MTYDKTKAPCKVTDIQYRYWTVCVCAFAHTYIHILFSVLYKPDCGNFRINLEPFQSSDLS